MHRRITWQGEACPKFRSPRLNPRDSDLVGLGLSPGICVFKALSKLFVLSKVCRLYFEKNWGNKHKMLYSNISLVKIVNGQESPETLGKGNASEEASETWHRQVPVRHFHQQLFWTLLYTVHLLTWKLCLMFNSSKPNHRMVAIRKGVLKSFYYKER